jgi:hypothetical protein
MFDILFSVHLQICNKCLHYSNLMYLRRIHLNVYGKSRFMNSLLVKLLSKCTLGNGYVAPKVKKYDSILYGEFISYCH